MSAWNSPFSPPGMLAGFRVIECPDRPRYVLPPEVIPGVPWPPGFRDDINAWSLSFLGTWNQIPRDTAYLIAGNVLYARPEHIVALKNIGGF